MELGELDEAAQAHMMAAPIGLLSQSKETLTEAVPSLKWILTVLTLDVLSLRDNMSGEWSRVVAELNCLAMTQTYHCQSLTFRVVTQNSGSHRTLVTLDLITQKREAGLSMGQELSLLALETFPGLLPSYRIPW